MSDNITCLQTIKDNKAKKKAYGIEQAGIAVSKVKMSPKDRSWQRNLKKWEEEEIKKHMDENKFSREDAIKKIKENKEESQKRDRERKFYEKRMIDQLGEYFTGGSGLSAYDGIPRNHLWSIRDIENILTALDSKQYGQIEDKPKDWLLDKLYWRARDHLSKLEAIFPDISKKMDALNYSKD